MHRRYLSRWNPQDKRTMSDSLAVRMALRELPTEIQHKIMSIVNEPPQAPKKQLSARVRAHIERWANPNRPKITPRILFT